MRRLALLGLLAFALAAGVSSAAPQIDWASLKYVHFDLAGAELYVSTGKGWNGKVVKPLTEFPLGLVPRWALDAKRAPQALWLATCTPKRQTALFTFPFEAPGPADGGTLVIASAGLGTPAINSASVSVNGLEIGRTDSFWRTRGYTELKLDAADLKRFRYGANTIVVRASKPALPKGVKCNTANDRSSDRRRVGVAVGVFATFAADVQTDPSTSFQTFKLVTVNDRTRRVYVKAEPNRSLVIKSNLKMRNAGPAASIDGKMIVDVTAGSSLRMLVGSGGPVGEPSGPAPFGKCETVVQNPFHFATVTCPYRDFPPKREVLIKIPWILKVAENLAVNFSQDKATLSWRVGGIDDDGTVNGLATLEIVFCGRFASDPGCAGAQ